MFLDNGDQLSGKILTIKEGRLHILPPYAKAALQVAQASVVRFQADGEFNLRLEGNRTLVGIPRHDDEQGGITVDGGQEGAFQVSEILEMSPPDKLTDWLLDNDISGVLAKNASSSSRLRWDSKGHFQRGGHIHDLRLSVFQEKTSIIVNDATEEEVSEKRSRAALGYSYGFQPAKRKTFLINSGILYEKALADDSRELYLGGAFRYSPVSKKLPSLSTGLDYRKNDSQGAWAVRLELALNTLPITKGVELFYTHRYWHYISGPANRVSILESGLRFHLNSRWRLNLRIRHSYTAVPQIAGVRKQDLILTAGVGLRLE